MVRRTRDSQRYLRLQFVLLETLTLRVSAEILLRMTDPLNMTMVVLRVHLVVAGNGLLLQLDEGAPAMEDTEEVTDLLILIDPLVLIRGAVQIEISPVISSTFVLEVPFFFLLLCWFNDSSRYPEASSSFAPFLPHWGRFRCDSGRSSTPERHGWERNRDPPGRTCFFSESWSRSVL